jgi:hypothetical protein
MLELGEEYCFGVQAVNAAEIAPLPVPSESTFFGVFTVSSNEPVGVFNTPQIQAS